MILKRKPAERSCGCEDLGHERFDDLCGSLEENRQDTGRTVHSGSVRDTFGE